MKNLYESILSTNNADHASHIRDIKAKISDNHIEYITDYCKYYYGITFKEYLDNVENTIFDFDVNRIYERKDYPHAELYFDDGVLSMTASDGDFKIKEIFWVKKEDINKKPIIKGYYRKQWNKAKKDGYAEVTTDKQGFSSTMSHSKRLLKILQEKYKDIVS